MVYYWYGRQTIDFHHQCEFFPVHSILLFTLNKEEQKIVDAIFFFGGGIFPLVITQVQMWLEIWQWHSKIYLVFGSIFLYRRMRNSCIINGWKETCRSHQSALFVTSHVDWSSGKVSFLKLLLVFFTKVTIVFAVCKIGDVFGAKVACTSIASPVSFNTAH